MIKFDKFLTTFLVVALCSCGAKKPVNQEEFTSVSNEESYYGKGVASSSKAKKIPGTDIPSQVFFAFNSSEINDEGVDSIKKIATYANENKFGSILIGGNCDKVGTVEYNLALGNRRAVVAKNLLSKHYKGKIVSISYGKSKANNADDSLDRNDTFILNK